MCRSHLLCLAVAALLLGLLAPPAVARDEPAATETSQVDRALGDLKSPLARVRELAYRTLLDALPGARARILVAVPKAAPGVQAYLFRLLADDASDAALIALLDGLAAVDAAQRTMVFLQIVQDRATSKRMLKTLREARAPVTGGDAARQAGVKQLRGMLLRAEIEDKFIERKSASGNTGYYRGQYDHLKYARTAALNVVLHIAEDRAIAVPGVYVSGPYRFLRPRPINFWELRSMAINAIAELARPTDTKVLEQIAAYRSAVAEEVDVQRRFLRRLERRGIGTRHIGQVETQELKEEFQMQVNRLGDFLTAEYVIRKGDVERDAVNNYIHSVESLYNGYFRFPDSTANAIVATTRIRAGWYAEAIYSYRQQLSETYASKSTSYYNIACAYASWSLDTSLEAADRAEKKALALRNLAWSVGAGWDDVGWMAEDGDLDPIRNTPEYKQLVRQIRVSLGMLPSRDD